MNKTKEKRVAAPNRVAAGKRASWPLSPPCKKGFEGFVGFVTKIEIQSNNNQIIRTMKNIRFIAVIALMMMGGMTMKAQDYHPIVEEGKQWNVLFSYPWNPPEPPHRYTDIYKIEGDTLLDGVSYKVMYTTRNEDLTDWNCWGFLRETEDRQVFSRRPSTSDEQLLYDFSMQIGDTIFMYEDYMVVVEIGEVLVGDEPRQQIVLEYPFGETETWIEGIGSLYGIIDSGSHFLVGGSTDLLCYYEDGDLIWQNSYPSINSCYFVYSGGGQSGLVVTPTVLTFDEPAMPQTFTISNQLDVDVTITNIYVQPDDNIVLVSHTDLPQTIQPGESMDVEVELNGIGNKGYNTYHIYMLTSEGAKVVTVKVNDNLNPYYPIVQADNNRQKWNVVSISAVNWPNNYYTEIQSIRDYITLDGVDYKLVWKEDVYDSKRIAGAVREEDKRVYFRRKIEQNYQDEVLLYDFNLTVGDTVNVNWFDQKLGVLEESEVQVNGNMRRMLGLAEYYEDGTIGEVKEYWIEGVGSTYGFLNSGYEGMVGAYIQLLCYHENGNLIWDNEEFDDCVMNSNGAPSPFAPQGAEWYFNVSSFMGSPISYYHMEVLGDTIIQGHDCSIITRQFLDGAEPQYVYEENNKVYWYNQTLGRFTTLYDFDAEVGESWICEIDECSFEIRVDSIEEVTWEDHTYRVQHVTSVEGEYFYNYYGRIIEGIGSVEGLFPYPYACVGDIYDGPYPDWLRCYLVDGEMLYHEGSYNCDQQSYCWDGTVAEAYAGGNGTAESPYQIATSQQLALLAQQTSNGMGEGSYYELTDNIDLKDCVTGGMHPWVSIGDNNNAFKGHFDGNGHTISNLYQNEPSVGLESIGGLFGRIDGAVITNVIIENARIENGQLAGILVGWSKDSNILNCSVENSTMSNVKYSGGIAGAVVASESAETIGIEHCTSNVDFQETSYCGGMVGTFMTYAPFVIRDCKNFGAINGNEYAGGMVGSGAAYNNGTLTISWCENYGEVTSVYFAGGIGGFLTDIEVFFSFNRGTVTASAPEEGNSSLGGIVGSLIRGTVGDCYNTGLVKCVIEGEGEFARSAGGIVGVSTGWVYNTYNAGAVEGPQISPDDNYGAIAGFDTEIEHYVNCYWLEGENVAAIGHNHVSELPTCSTFHQGETSSDWILANAQYNTTNLVEALNSGMASDVVPDTVQNPLADTWLAIWLTDTENANSGFPVLGRINTEETIQLGYLGYYIISDIPPMVTVAYHVDGIDAHGEVVIPETVTYNTVTYKVVGIENLAFASCSGISSVVLGNELKRIGNNSFLGCIGLSEISIPNSVDTIAGGAFVGCSYLEIVELGTSVSYIGSEAFNLLGVGRMTVVCRGTTPPQCANNAFPDAEHQEVVIVPCGYLDVYRQAWAECWQSGNFEEDCGEGLIEFQGSEWYYEIQNENGIITYQHLEYVADTTINHKDVKIIIRTNTLYDKGEHNEVTREYVYREDQLVYWWNKDLQEFTVLYDLGAQEGDSWVIKVGTETLTMHVDAVGYNYYGGQLFKMLYVSDDQDLFSGTIVSGVGHLSSFFPERLMTRGKRYGVNGLRCYWRFGNLLFTVNRGDCDAIYAELHNGLDEPTAISFTIYPNPTDGILFVETVCTPSLPTQTYRITNLMGQTVQTGSLTAENQQIDVSGLPQGMYFISVGDGARKFVVR